MAAKKKPADKAAGKSKAALTEGAKRHAPKKTTKRPAAPPPAPKPAHNPRLKKPAPAPQHVVLQPVPAAELERRSEDVRKAARTERVPYTDTKGNVIGHRTVRIDTTDGADDPSLREDQATEPLWGQKLFAALIIAALVGAVVYWWLA